MSTTRPRFTPADLADVLVPGAPVVWGDELVHAVQRNQTGASKPLSSLFAVPQRGGPPRQLTRGDFRDRLPRADPRGAFLVFLSDRAGHDQVCRLDARGGEAEVLTAFPRGSISDLVVSPDGSRAAVVFAAAAPEDDDLPLAADLVRGGGALRVPEALPGRASAGAASGREPAERTKAPRARIVVRLRNREEGRGWLGGRTHVWVIDTRSGEAMRVTREERDFSWPAWTPDGRSLLACATARPDEVADCDPTRNDLVKIDVETRSVAQLVKPEGTALACSVSPRGDRAAYVLWRADDDFGHDNALICVSPLEAGDPVVLSAALDRSALDVVIDDLVGGVLRPERPIWSADGERVTCIVSDHGAVRLWEQPVSGGPGRYRSDADHAVGCSAPLPGGEVASVVTSGGTFPEIGVVDAQGAVRILTAHNARLAERCGSTAPERVAIQRDGVELHGYYYAPRGVAAGGRAAGLLYIHGGPCVAYGERLFFEMQWLADLGYGVLCPNPRGSQSYGHAYAATSSWGEPDRGDQLAFADWMAARPEIDGDRLAVLGGSYGGFMTLLLCATTRRFRAAIAERGLYNWASLVGASDFGQCHARIFGGKWAWEEPQRYLEASPLRLVAQVETPMLVIHQEGDLRVDKEQGLQLFTALKRQGVPTALLLFPEEDHGMTRGGRMDRRLERLRQLEAWLRAWLE